MEIRIVGDAVEIDGYVNAVERKSKPLWSRIGQFVERICKGAFTKALKRNDNVRILLNHDPQRDLGGQRDGNLELSEDNIGLRVKARICDPDVVKKARNNDLVGWSFGFYDREVDLKTDEDGFPMRDVRDLDLEEVSILDRSCSPAYEGTLVTVRDDGKRMSYSDTFEDEIQVREETEPEQEPEEKPEERSEEPKEEPKQETVEDKVVNFDEYDKLIADLKS